MSLTTNKYSIFLLLFSLIFCIEDYYKILGVNRKATQPEIRRAFKKLALKYHPDKTKDKSDGAREKFAKIANAYETLNDPQKRKEYDDELDGKVNFNNFGSSDHNGRYSQHYSSGGNSRFNRGDFDFGDIFGDMFGDNNGFGFGGGFGAGHGNKKKNKPFENTNVIILKMNNIKDLYKRTEVWFVLFYKYGEKKLVEVFKSLATKSIGLFKIAAVNCEEDEEICEEFNVEKHPMILYFSDNSNDSEEAYKGNKTVEDLFSFASKHMQNFVKKLDKENYYKFLNFKSPLYKVILFTSKPETPPLFKALSKAFREKLIFLEIQDLEKEVVNKFRIRRFPTILVLTDPDNYSGEIYKGHFKRKEIDAFLQQYAEKKIDVDKKPIYSLFTEQVFKQNNCNHNDAKNICVIYLNRNSYLPNEIKSLLVDLSKKYLNDPLKFFYVNIGNNKSFLRSFENTNECNFLAIKGKRKQYKSFCDSNEKIHNFLDELVSGTGNYKRLKSDLFQVPEEKKDL